MPTPIDQTALSTPVSINEDPDNADDWQVAEDKIDTAITRVQQIQDQLGADPAGASADVKTRFDGVDTSLAAKETPAGAQAKVDTHAAAADPHTGYQKESEKGAASGYAELDSGGKVPTAQLPSYVDDVLEYIDLASFPATGETGKIYVAKDTNLTYRWSGSAYVEISPSLALGETSATAYRGDRGKAAYDHSQMASGNPHAVTAAQAGAAPAAQGVTNGDSHDHSGGDGAAITDANLSTSDITTNDVSTAKHGFVPKAPNDASKFLRGDATWATAGGGITVSDTAPASPTNGQYWYESDTGILWVYETNTGWRDVKGENVEFPTWTKRLNAQFLPQPFTSPTTVLTAAQQSVGSIEKAVIMRSAENDKFYMWTTCGSAPWGVGNYFTYRNRSDSPAGSFNDNKTTVVWNGTKWYTGVPNISSIVDNGGGNMQMWFSSYDATGYAIGYATSTDYGINWTLNANYITAFGRNAWGSTNVNYGLKVYKLANCYVGFYANKIDTAGGSSIKTAYSTDGFTWTLASTAITCGLAGAFDDGATNYFGVYFDSGTWYLIYAAYDGATWTLGLAYRTGDPFGAFTKAVSNPIYTTNSYGFDMIKFNGKFYVYGNDGATTEIFCKELST